MAGRLAFWIAGSAFGGWMVGLVFTWFSAWLPVRDAAQNPDLKIFHHPKPIDDPHILLVPKRPVRSALALSGTRIEQDIWQAFATAIPVLASQYTPTGARVFFNGGIRQDVAQLHLHITTSTIFINGWETDRAARGSHHLVLENNQGAGLADQIITALQIHGTRLETARGFTFVFGDADQGIYQADQTNCLHLIIDEDTA